MSQKFYNFSFNLHSKDQNVITKENQKKLNDSKMVIDNEDFKNSSFSLLEKILDLEQNFCDIKLPKSNFVHPNSNLLMLKLKLNLY